MSVAKPLKLRARDAEDLQTIAACIQDALVPLSEMRYLPQERRFALMLNRFRWEVAPEATSSKTGPETAPADGDAAFADAAGESFERVHAALVFDRVRKVKRRRLAEAAAGGMLALLTLRLDGRQVTLSFAGGAAVSLDVDQVSCHLEDLGEGWPTVWRPEHTDDKTPEGR
jgi:hypothetical protein